SSKPYARRSAPAARACATSSAPTATPATSSNAIGSTTARANRPAAAEASFARSSRASGLRFTVRPARSDFGFQFLFDVGMNELRNIAPERRELAHQRRGDEHVLLG